MATSGLQAMQAQPSATQLASNVHILLVDDERLSRVVVANLLRKCNYKVTVAESGGQAMELLRQEAPGTFQLLLTDVMMPQVDGIELLRYVRSHKELADLPVVMMSASEQAETMFKCIKGGAEEYLVKPVTQKEIQKIWTHVVKRASSPGLLSGAQGPLRLLPSADGPSTAQQGRLGTGQATNGQPQDPRQAAGQVNILLPPPQAADASALQGAAPSQQPVALSALQAQHAPQRANGVAAAVAAAIAEGVADNAFDRSRAARAAAQTGKRNGTAQANGTGGASAHSMSLRAWLSRPNRRVQYQECLWVFTEVLLLIEAAHKTPDACLGTRLRPSRLVLHSTGSVTWAPDASPNSAQQAVVNGAQRHAQDSSGGGSMSGGVVIHGSPMDVWEEAAYRSPEESAGVVLSSATDLYTAGLVLLELLVPITGAKDKESTLAAWQALIGQAKSGTLPAAFVEARPAEAALVRSLLQSDPTTRPILPSVLAADWLQRTVTAVRQRHAAAAGPAGAAGAAASSKDIVTRDAPHTLVPGPAPRPEPDIDIALMGDFLTMMHSRKCAELRAAEVSLGALTEDVGLLEATIRAVQDDEAQRAGKRRRVASRMQSFNMGPGGASSLARDVSSPTGSLPQSLSAWHGSDAAVAALARAAAVAPAPPPEASVSAHARDSGDTAAAAPDADGPVRGAAERWKRIASSHSALEDLYLSARSKTLANGTVHKPATANAPTATTPTITTSKTEPGPSEPAASAASGLGNAAPAAATATANQGPKPAPPPPTTAPATSPPPAHHPPTTSAASLPTYMTSFADNLSHFTRYRRLKLAASMQHGDSLSSANMVCCIAFDRDDEFFATAGVSKRIRLYDLQRVMRAGGVAGGYPVLELTSRSRLSSVCWSAYVKSQLAAADYEGVVALWDVNTNIELMQFEEHSKRVWAVDMCREDPTRLASASDDGTVRVWAINQENSTACIQCPANVCSVQWNPESSHLLSLGAANCWAAVYDLRNSVAPVYTISGHQKAVSYVRHVNGSQLLTASTDNTIRRWDLPLLTNRLAQGDNSVPGGQGDSAAGAAADAAAGACCALGSRPEEPVCSLVYRGHVNERNFVGLSVSPDGYIACGSEDNSVVCYHLSLPLPALTHSFSEDPLDALQPAGMRHHRGGGGGGYTHDRDQVATSSGPPAFVSSVCWAQNRGMLLSANSLGIIRVLQLD